MSHVLVFPLILALFSSRHCYVTAMKETNNSCFKTCPPGYHKTGGCRDGKSEWHECKECGENTFTHINNTVNECQRCNVCGFQQETIKNCTRSNDYVCDCEKDYYNTSHNEDLNCKSCKYPPGVNDKDTDYIKKCKPCQRSDCLTKPECRRKYRCDTVTRAPPATTTSTTISATFTRATATGTKSTPSPTARPSKESQLDHDVSHFVWLAVVFTVIFGLLLLKKLFGGPRRCPYWRTKKVVMGHKEDPKFTEQHSHQDIASTTLAINACEETPMMDLSQSPFTPEHPAPASALLPNTDHRGKTPVQDVQVVVQAPYHTVMQLDRMISIAPLEADRQDEQSKRWPAIVLYAIIKEVPLRRWKEFLRLLSVADEQMERIELEAGLGMGSMERQYLMLRLWSQRATSNLSDVFSALHYMDLVRSAQMLQENLENLQWRPESKQDFPV